MHVEVLLTSLEAGVRFVTVSFGGWDHHAKVFESLDKKLPDFDNGEFIPLPSAPSPPPPAGAHAMPMS